MSCRVAALSQRLLHAAELAVEHLPAQQVLDLLVRLAGLVAAPVVVAQLPHRPGRVVAAARPARPRPSGRRRTGRGTAPAARPPSALSSSSRTCCRVPSSRPRRRASPLPLRGPGGAARRARAARRCRAAAAGAAPRAGLRPASTVVADLVQRLAGRRTAARADPARRARRRTGSRRCGIVSRRRPCGRADARPWPAGGAGAAPPGRTRAPRRPGRGDSGPSTPSRVSSCGQRRERCRAWRSSSAAGTRSPVSTDAPSSNAPAAPDRSSPASRARKVSAVAWRSRCASTSSSRPSSVASNSTLPRHGRDDGGQVADPGDGLGLAGDRGPADGGGGDRLDRGDREPGRDAGALVDLRRLADQPG